MTQVLLPGHRRIYAAGMGLPDRDAVREAAQKDADRMRFAALLEDLVRQKTEAAAPTPLVTLPENLKALLTDAGGRTAPLNNPMGPIESLGQLNAALGLNVMHFTGDVFLMKSGTLTSRYEAQEPKRVKPVQSPDGNVSQK